MVAGGGNFGSSYNTYAGIATLAVTLTNWVNNNIQGGIALNPYQGHIYINGADSLVGGSPLNNSDVICMAIDFGNLRAWFRANNGNWNWNASNNPATNVGGIDISAVFTGVAAYPTVGFYINGDAATGNFGASAFTYPVPSGFVSWDSPALPPPVVAPGQTFTVAQPAVMGQVVGTVVATNSPTSFTVVSGNYFGFYTIDNTGVIRVASIPVSGTANLIVQASNASGSGSNTVVVIAGGVASYLLLVPHYMGGAELSAGTVVTEGSQIPVGWIPTLAVDPQDAVAIQNYWNAGPQDGAEPNRDFYPWVPLKATTYWVPIAGVQGYWQLTGTGASLGSKNAPLPQLPVIPSGPPGASGTSMGLLLALTYA
jgi:hypothetical protein